MRIRKTVTKLLGSAIVYPSLTANWVPLQSVEFLEGSVDCGQREVCQLNQSPWDAASPPNLDLFLTAACQGLESVEKSRKEPSEKKEKEERAKAITAKSGGILVNSTLKDENKTKPIWPCKSDHREKKSKKKTSSEPKVKTDETKEKPNSETKEKNNNETKEKSNNKTKEKNSNETKEKKNNENKDKNNNETKEKSDNETKEKNNNETKETSNNETKEKNSEEILYCKKNDGRKWFCKRPAQPPHSFCEYHVVQSRSYNTGLLPKPKPKSNKKPKKDTTKDKDSSSSFYYYYEGFGPWRGKRRGERNTEHQASVSNKEGESDKELDRAVMDGCDLPMDGVNDDDNEDYEELIASCNLRGNGEKKVGKKRGRKPLKCRSLKSLM